MSYLTQQEVEEEFDERWSQMFASPADKNWRDSNGKLIKDYISQIRQNDLKALQEWAEGMKGKYVENHYKSQEVEAKTKSLINDISNRTLTDVINHLSSLNQ